MQKIWKLESCCGIPVVLDPSTIKSKRDLLNIQNGRGHFAGNDEFKGAFSLIMLTKKTHKEQITLCREFSIEEVFETPENIIFCIPFIQTLAPGEEIK